MAGGSLRVLPASSTTKTGRHDIAEILLKVALNTKNQIKSNQIKLNLDFKVSFKSDERMYIRGFI
jgi:hypothetical protein